MSIMLILGMIGCSDSSDSKSPTDPSGGGNSGTGLATIIDLINPDKYDVAIFVAPNEGVITLLPLTWGTYSIRVNGANVPLEREGGQLIGYFNLGFNAGQTYHFILGRNGVDTNLSLTIPIEPVITFPSTYSSMQNFTLNWTLPQGSSLQVFGYGFEKHEPYGCYYCRDCWHWWNTSNPPARCPSCSSHNISMCCYDVLDSGYFYRTLSALARTFTLNANNMPTNQDLYLFTLGTVNFNMMGRVSIASGNGVAAVYDHNGNLVVWDDEFWANNEYNKRPERRALFNLLDLLK